MNHLFKEGYLALPGEFFPNQMLTLVDTINPSHTALATVEGESGKVVTLHKLPHGGVSRIYPRNQEQKFALELLLNDAISLVTLVGKAGTGKTLLAIAAGLQKVADERLYTRLLISRPVIPMGKDIGYPGCLSTGERQWRMVKMHQFFRTGLAD
jgi:PhoH-like ATPase